MPDDVEDLSEFHEELRAAARGLLAASGPDANPDRESIVRAGWTELEVPADFGGAGGTFAETAVILTELGRAAARTRYSSVALSIATLGMLRPGESRDRLRAAVVNGSAIPAVVLGAESVECAPLTLSESAGEFFLDGTATFVADVSGADPLLVLATDRDGDPVVVVLEPDRAARLRVADTPVLDATRHFGTVHADAVAVPPDAIRRFVEPDAAVAALRARAAVSLACDSLGLAEAMLERTVDYCSVREQFGRRIGSFQAVKHTCADMLVSVTVARKLVSAAVRDVARGKSGATSVSMAKSYACAAAVEIAGKAVQLHGGIGYTWESGIHVYLKRATLNRSLHGSPADHRRRLALRYSNPVSSNRAAVASF